MTPPHHDALPPTAEDRRRIFDAIPTPFLILDPHLTVVSANAAYLHLMMARREDVLGRRFFDVFPDNPGDPGATGIANLRASLARVLATGQPDTMPVQRYDVHRPPRQAGFEERYWSPINTPVFDPQGKIIYLIHRVVDVTDYTRVSDEIAQVGGECESLQARLEVLEIEIFERSSELKAANQQLQELNERLRDSEETLRLSHAIGHTGTFDWDIAADTMQWTPEFAALYGFPARAFSSSIAKWRKSVHRDDRAAVDGRMTEAIESGSFEAEWRIAWPDGSLHWLAGRAAVYPDSSGVPKRMLGVHIDITERKNIEESLRRAALHDPLTGLPNRALIFEYGEHLLGAARRARRACALLYIDLDRFKPINDSYGHEAGDAVLREVARRLRECTRQEDLIGRLGGDEFVVVLPRVDGVVQVAQHITDAVSRPIRVNALQLSVSPSIGISYYPEQGEDMAALLQKADVAMYEAKQDGLGKCRTFSSNLEQRAGEAAAAAATLRAAMDRGELMLHYQPILNLRDGRLVAAEALLRMVMEDGRTRCPYTFVKDIDRSGLGARLDEWVLTAACRQHEDWMRRGFGRFIVSVNISPCQFAQPAFPDKVRRIVAATGMDPALLQVEVSEGIMARGDEAADAFQRFKAVGVKTALDGFGSTPFTLGQLSALPVDRVKMGQSIVRAAGDASGEQRLSRLVITLGHMLHFDVVGEGIESEDALLGLRHSGCDEAQGFLLSRPLPADEFARWYREHRMH